MATLPTGTITFLFTDIEGSSGAWEVHPEEMRTALARHDEMLRKAIGDNSGHVFATGGDGFAAAFQTATQAIYAAEAGQRALAAEAWPPATTIRVRMGLHTGEADERDGDYFGPAVNRASRLMAAGHGGQVLVSDTTRQVVAGQLGQGRSLVDLGEHRLRDLSRAEHIHQLRTDGLGDEFPPLRVLDPARHNLPVARTPLIGRARELDELADLLAAERLVTLTAVGGAGKTRLALEAAARAAELFPDGTYFVELGSVRDPDALGAQVASAILGPHPLAETEARTPELQSARLVREIGERRLLIALDNCEHLIESCARLAGQLLDGCPGVSIIATSREALFVAGERLYPVGPLRDGNSFGASVQLFIERARAVRPGVHFDVADLETVETICRRLDGVPLAIELAAAKVRVLGTKGILARLDDALRLLSGGSRDAVERHQTMTAALDWSYQLCTEQEQIVLSRLGVFVGGCTLEAAEQVCADGATVESGAVLEALTGLVDHNLVEMEVADGRERYRLLEPVRQFGVSRLAQSSLTETVRRHGDWVLSVLERAAADTAYGAQSLVEADNVLAAGRRALEAEDWDRALRLSGTSLLIYAGRSGDSYALARGVLEVVPEDAAPQLLAENAMHNAVLAAMFLDFEFAEFALSRAASVADRCDLLTSDGIEIDRELALAGTRGFISICRGDVEGSLTAYEVARAWVAERGRDDTSNLHPVVSTFLGNGAVAAIRCRDLIAADRFIQTASELYGDRLPLHSVITRETVALVKDPARSSEPLQQALRQAAMAGIPFLISSMAYRAAEGLLAAERTNECASALVEGLRAARQGYDLLTAGMLIATASRIASRHGDHDVAVRLVSCVDDAWERAGGRPRSEIPLTAAEFAAGERAARDALGAQAYEAAARAGRELTVSGAAEAALAYLETRRS